MKVFHADSAGFPTQVMKYSMPQETFTIPTTTALLRQFASLTLYLRMQLLSCRPTFRQHRTDLDSYPPPAIHQIFQGRTRTPILSPKLNTTSKRHRVTSAKQPQM